MYFWYDNPNKTVHFANAKTDSEYTNWLPGGSGSWWSYCKAEYVVFDDGPVKLPVDSSSLFFNCRCLTAIDATQLDTTAVKDFTAMFYNCGQITELDVSGFDTTNAKRMGSMFRNCYDLATITGSDWTSLVDQLDSYADMFRGCWAAPHYSCSKVSIAQAKPDDGTDGYFA